VCKAFLPGRIFWLQPDQIEERRRGKNSFYHTIRRVLLSSHAFWLKNAGATYQRMMQNCLGSQIGRNIQVYIDDVVITTRKEESLISDLAENFNNLNRYKLKLSLTKCSFGVSAGQLLGFLVSARGIEANPGKIQANINNGETNKVARRPETRRACRGTKSIRCTIRRKSTSFLCTHEKVRRQI
jgi:hypothetical protein